MTDIVTPTELTELETGIQAEPAHDTPDCDNLTYEFIDSHCHFDDDAFAHDRPEVWLACQSRGVKTLVIPGVEPQQWPHAVVLSQTYAGVYYALGVHPWWIEKLSAADHETWQQRLRECVHSEKCVAIGECGLDGTINTPIADQLPVFEAHLELAQSCHKPVIIHSVKAHNDVLALLKKYHLPAGGVVHAFSGSLEQALAYWQLGFFVGIGGTITYERALKTRRAVAAMPLEAILLETDAPFMPLSGHQGQRNRPDLLPDVAKTLAELRAQTLQKIAQQTTYNAQTLFGWL